MIILTAANHVAMLNELEKALTAIFTDSEHIQKTDALMAGKYAFNHKVDFVFAEAYMKRMNGLQLIQFARFEHSDVKSYLIGSEKEISESFLITSDDVAGVLTYQLTENAIRDD